MLWLAPVGTLVAQEPAEQGKQYFMSNGCYGCHAVGRMGTPIGPDLSHVGAKYSLAYLHRWLRDPAEQRPSAHMPDSAGRVPVHAAVRRGRWRRDRSRFP